MMLHIAITFLSKTRKTQSMEETINKLDCIKFKKSGKRDLIGEVRGSWAHMSHEYIKTTNTYGVSLTEIDLGIS